MTFYDPQEPVAEFVYSTPCPLPQQKSKTYLYVISWQGELLFSARLTQQMLWRMRSFARKSKAKLAIEEQRLRPAAQMAWAYCYLCRNKMMSMESFEMVANTWTHYFATDQVFNMVYDKGFDSGLQLVAVGWKLQDDRSRIFPIVTVNREKFNGSNLRVLAAHVMSSQRQINPSEMPSDQY